MCDSAQPAIDRLDRLRKPLVARQAEIDNTGTSTTNMARALASHAERTIDLGDAILDEMTARAGAGATVAAEDAGLHARLAHIACYRKGA
ncbi:hypothetical protein ABIB42_002080 [Massilia sp. UYP32]|jgi:hypothetical protein|uniref:Uncharacterized protein n=1 Tax=Massilia timonae CCUG 45783 TaxID=883126 RepID=K9DA78_9BURK|nr:hypothetical protein [Massilia timonae]EKU81629.1 hypothetical protein HMPREF9710_03469 [Massilia timonae CCUG 45783]HAK90133.1 hypothetical protein [Massilia timonae]